MLRISWAEHVTNQQILEREDRKKELLTTTKYKEIAYILHVYSDEKYGVLHVILKGKNEGRRGVEDSFPQGNSKLTGIKKH